MVRRDLAPALSHPTLSRRAVVQAGAIGLLGFGMNHVAALQAEAALKTSPKARNCIFLFLSGGLSQIDSFDMKPATSEVIRGPFMPIATAVPGLEICEHLPLLAARSRLWSLCRSLTHPSNEHFDGTTLMLTGRSSFPAGTDRMKPSTNDSPSIAAVANAVLPARSNLPAAMILPERLIEPRFMRAPPGQGAGMMGATREPWFVDAAPFRGDLLGAYPGYEFTDLDKPFAKKDYPFQAPNLSLPEGLASDRFRDRLALLKTLVAQRAVLEGAAESLEFDRFRADAVSLLADKSTQRAFDVHAADPAVQDRYGRNSFGRSCLMARQLVEAGVGLVQVNLGSMSTWDTHGNAAEHLRDKLFPPTDRAVAALLDDLNERGLLDSTLVVMASEFGRTPYTSSGPSYKSPGRNHWGGVQSILLAGGGIQGGRVVGASDKQGAYPDHTPQRPENFAATIYQALGIPQTTAWHDGSGRPHFVYHDEPIPGLF
ncbi:MAG: DUF1501 domain-containing protein [Planctomycetia bacterium]|nr:DUF1501 domain-containing protein [Planctomycetia bacterium]